MHVIFYAMPKELKGIIQPKDNATLWRYMSFEKFANILATESLFFSQNRIATEKHARTPRPHWDLNQKSAQKCQFKNVISSFGHRKSGLNP